MSLSGKKIILFSHGLVSPLLSFVCQGWRDRSACLYLAQRTGHRGTEGDRWVAFHHPRDHGFRQDHPAPKNCLDSPFPYSFLVSQCSPPNSIKAASCPLTGRFCPLQRGTARDCPIVLFSNPSVVRKFPKGSPGPDSLSAAHRNFWNRDILEGEGVILDFHHG